MGTKLEFQFALTIPGDIWMFFFEEELGNILSTGI
jgi:hypothetical protein